MIKNNYFIYWERTNDFMGKADSSKTALDLTNGNPLKLIILFAIPVFFGRLFQYLYSVVDTKIVGSILGEQALASVSSVVVLYNLLTGFFNGITLGFSVITARFFGGKDEKSVKKSVADSIILSFITAFVVIISVVVFLEPILELLNVGNDHFEMSLGYIRILVWGMFITLAYNLCANLLRAIGDSITPLVFLIISSVLNVILDYILIMYFNMGVKGAAVATVTAQLISVVLCFFRIIKGFPILHVSRSDFNINRNRMIKMYESGLSMGMMSCLVSFGTLVLQSGINQLGNSIIIAHTSARKVFEIWCMPVAAIGSAMATFCGQNYGAQKYERIRKGIKSTLLIGAVWCVVVLILAYTISPYLISFISSSDNEVIIMWGTRYLKLDMIFLFVCVAIIIIRNSLQGVGDHKTPVFSSFIELIGKLVFTFVFVKMFGYWGIIWTEPVIWIIMVIPLIVSLIKINKKL